MNKDLKKAEIIAPKCKNNYACITGDKNALGKVDYNVSDKVLFVNPEENNFCPYLHSYGHSHYCACPLRMKEYLESEKNPK